MSMQDEQVVQLLREIRAGQQEHLALYREITQRSLDAQQTAIDWQRRSARLYRIVVAVGAVLIAGLVAYLYSLPI
jgi:hypothetical protein